MPSSTRVKICGLTRPEDAEAAVQLGASWLGVVFAGGPRLQTPERARQIVAAAGQVPVLGVFGSQGRDEILRTRDAARLAGAQLHGGASPDLVFALGREGMLVVAVARLAGPADLPELDPLTLLGVPILVEPRVAGRLGGSGAPLALETARAARERLRGHRMFLAGGLTPETVAQAVGAVRPDAVDVSSGVEQIPGIKDHNKLARFLEAVRWA
jgi:phosphoribosylanthranilate isomerase